MIKISAIKYNNELRASQDLTYLLSCIGEKVKIDISYYYEDIIYAIEGGSITFKPDATDIDLFDSTGIILLEDNTSFKNTYVGDKIGVFDNSSALSYYTVLEKFNNGMIRTDGGFSNGILDNGKYIFNCTPFNGVRFAFNLIESGNSKLSYVDSEYQEGICSTADASNTTPVNMSFLGLKSYQIGSMSVRGDGCVGGGATLGTSIQQKFILTHNTVITPFFLKDQYADLLIRKKPDYFEANKTLHYRADFKLGRNLTNPNNLQSLTIPDSLSNVGWFNEKFNGEINYYTIDSVVYKDGANVVTALEFGKDITVEITISNTTESPFSNTNTKYIAGFNFLPEDESLYQNNGFDQTRNFLFDSKLNTLGSGSANGANFGNGMQVIKTVTSTFISATQMKVALVIRIGSDAEAILKQGTYNRYMLWLITEDHAKTAVQSNKVNILLDVNEFYVKKYDTDLIVKDKLEFILHPDDTEVDSQDGADFTYFPVDDIVSFFRFHIDFNGHLPAEKIKISNIKCELYAKNLTGDEVIFETKNIITTSYAIVGGKAQNISFSQDRGFKIPSEIRRFITIDRDYASDNSDKRYFILKYPFMVRWEYWVQLLGLTTIPVDIFNPALPSNGINNFWERISTLTDWSLNYRVVFTLEQNGVTFNQTFNEELENGLDFEGNTEWTTNSIKSFNTTTNAEIVSGGNKFIYGYEDVRIEAKFVKTSGPIPLLAHVHIVIWIETFEQGGVLDVRRISSAHVLDSQSWFKSIDTSDKVVITNVGNVFTGKCLINHDKLPANKKFTVYARIYNFSDTSSEKEFQDAQPFEFQDTIDYQFQDQ